MGESGLFFFLKKTKKEKKKDSEVGKYVRQVV